MHKSDEVNEYLVKAKLRVVRTLSRPSSVAATRTKLASASTSGKVAVRSM